MAFDLGRSSIRMDQQSAIKDLLAKSRERKNHGYRAQLVLTLLSRNMENHLSITVKYEDNREDCTELNNTSRSDIEVSFLFDESSQEPNSAAFHSVNDAAESITSISFGFDRDNELYDQVHDAESFGSTRLRLIWFEWNNLFVLARQR